MNKVVEKQHMCKLHKYKLHMCKRSPYTVCLYKGFLILNLLNIEFFV